MSRVGKKPIPLPKGVKITIGDEHCWWKDPKASSAYRFRTGSDAPGGRASGISRDSDQYAALHGLTRALAAAAVQGVSTGFTRELDITGIGYRADVKGKIATFTLGYSHPIEVLLPEGVDLKIDKQTHLVLERLRQADGGPGGREYPRACVRPIRTRTRASATPAKCCARRSARPARRSRSEVNGEIFQE